MTTKERLHQLVDQLSENEMTAAERILQAFHDNSLDSLSRALLEAEEDDEPLTEEDEAAIADGIEQYKQGKVKPLRPAH